MSTTATLATSAYASLRQKEDRLKDVEIAKMRNSLVPAVNLPFELLFYIFELAIIFPLDDRGVRVPMTYLAGFVMTSPLSLGAICSKWRDITLAAPQLWSNITIILHGTMTFLQAARVQYWLKRAADCPLSIIIREGPYFSRWDLPIAPALLMTFEALLDRAEFWQSIDISLFSVVPITKKHTFSMLSTIKLSALGLGYQSVTFANLLNLFTLATPPLLRHVTLDYLYYMGPTPPWAKTVSTVKLPFQQLESISGFFEMLEQPVEMLRLYPNLRHAQFEARGPSLWKPFPDQYLIIQPLHNDTLQSLTLKVQSISDEEINQLFSALTLPSLHTFSCSSYYYTMIKIDICSFLSRSSCDLQSLHLACDISEDEILQCLKLLPSLVTLQIDSRYLEYGLAEAFIDSLHPFKRSINSPCLVPKLQHLKYTGGINFSGASLADLLTFRWRWANMPGSDGTVAQLRTVQLNSSSFQIYDPAYVTVFEGLRKEGMYIS